MSIRNPVLMKEKIDKTKQKFAQFVVLGFVFVVLLFFFLKIVLI